MIGSLRDTKNAHGHLHKKERIYDQEIQEQNVEHATELSEMRLANIEMRPIRSGSKVG